MKKIVIIIICLLFSITTVCAYTIQAGVSVDKVPKTLFGSWQVEAQLVETNAAGTFKPKSRKLNKNQRKSLQKKLLYNWFGLL